MSSVPRRRSISLPIFRPLLGTLGEWYAMSPALSSGLERLGIVTTTEVYQLQCSTCHWTVEIPALPAAKAEKLTCPSCGAVLSVEWRPVPSDASAHIVGSAVCAGK